MDTFRFGRKLGLPSTIAIKHRVMMLMADDRAKTAEEETKRARSTYIPQMKVGLERLTSQPRGSYGHRFAAALAWLVVAKWRPARVRMKRYK